MVLQALLTYCHKNAQSPVGYSLFHFLRIHSAAQQWLLNSGSYVTYILTVEEAEA